MTLFLSARIICLYLYLPAPLRWTRQTPSTVSCTLTKPSKSWPEYELHAEHSWDVDWNKCLCAYLHSYVRYYVHIRMYVRVRHMYVCMHVCNTLLVASHIVRASGMELQEFSCYVFEMVTWKPTSSQTGAVWVSRLTYGNKPRRF